MKVKLCVVIFIACLLLNSCQGPSNKTGEKIDPDKSKFPAFLVGVWESKYTDKNTWGFKFESDGSISKIIHHWAGPIKVADGGSQGDGPEPDTYFLIALGPCEADYDSQTRILKVKVVLDNWVMKFPEESIQGRDEDYFSGPISEDGKTWQVEWRNLSWLEGAEPPDVDSINANPEKITFTKIDLN